MAAVKGSSAYLMPSAHWKKAHLKVCQQPKYSYAEHCIHDGEVVGIVSD